MLIWRGYGILVPVVTFLTLIMTEFSVENITNNENYYQENSWVILLALTVSAIICFLISIYFDSKKFEKVYIEKETGKEVIIRNKNTFFFIEIKYWSILLPLFGVIYVISTLS